MLKTLAGTFPELQPFWNQLPPVYVGKHGRHAMAVALEISFALWVLIGCAAMKAAQLVQYLV
jgi:hypothetical protein